MTISIHFSGGHHHQFDCLVFYVSYNQHHHLNRDDHVLTDDETQVYILALA